MTGVVIAGAGHAGLAAALELRASGYTAPITMLDRSAHAPYERPPISKAWIAGQDGPEGLLVQSEQSLTDAGIRLVRGAEILGLDRSRRVVQTAEGDIEYDALILALGAMPRPLGIAGRELGGVHALHTVEHAQALRDDLADAKRLVVVGGGFIGLEIASTMADRMEVSVVEAAGRLMGRATSEITSAHMRTRHEALGVRFHLGVGVAGFEGEDGRVRRVALADGTSIEADAVVLGIGVVPNGSWVQDAGIEFADGVLVDDHLRTNDPNVYAIGDCARFPRGAGATMRLESVGNAVDHARRVANSITGAGEQRADVPWFWTKQAGVRLQMVGHIDQVDEWLISGDPDATGFSVIGLRDDRIVYGESINRPGDHVALRKALTNGIEPLAADARPRLADGLKPVLAQMHA